MKNDASLLGNCWATEMASGQKNVLLQPAATLETKTKIYSSITLKQQQPPVF